MEVTPSKFEAISLVSLKPCSSSLSALSHAFFSHNSYKRIHRGNTCDLSDIDPKRQYICLETCLMESMYSLISHQPTYGSINPWWIRNPGLKSPLINPGVTFYPCLWSFSTIHPPSCLCLCHHSWGSPQITRCQPKINKNRDKKVGKDCLLSVRNNHRWHCAHSLSYSTFGLFQNKIILYSVCRAEPFLWL